MTFPTFSFEHLSCSGKTESSRATQLSILDRDNVCTYGWRSLFSFDLVLRSRSWTFDRDGPSPRMINSLLLSSPASVASPPNCGVWGDGLRVTEGASADCETKRSLGMMLFAITR